jgi:UPF0176 protein
MKPFSVLLYYIYTKIELPENTAEENHLFCINNNLLGRVIVAEEGLNGTISGLTEDCERFMAWIKSDERFKNIDFKIESSEKNTFQKLYVRVKNEIVNSDLPVDPTIQTGKHLEPAAFKNIMNDPDVVLVDMRSNYEHGVGKFKNAITFDMENLRELPDHIAEIEQYKDKKIITYCTGGIKCEKASAFLLANGFENVYQLHGGIIKYGIEEGGEDFEGKCYVFDGRVTTDVNSINPTVISKCYVCEEISDRMVNCANPECNEHVCICDNCGIKLKGACSENCMHSPTIRPYNVAGYYAKNSNGYTPLVGYKSKKKNDKIAEKLIKK